MQSNVVNSTPNPDGMGTWELKPSEQILAATFGHIGNAHRRAALSPLDPLERRARCRRGIGGGAGLGPGGLALPQRQQGHQRPQLIGRQLPLLTPAGAWAVGSEGRGQEPPEQGLRVLGFRVFNLQC